MNELIGGARDICATTETKREVYGAPCASICNKEPAQLQFVEDFPPFGNISHGDLLALSLATKTTSLTHSLHRFPAKYIPQIPRWAIRQFASSDAVVLDPFMGSGTSLVEGVCSVRKTYGTDIDPLARLISRAKTAKYDVIHLNALALTVLAAEAQDAIPCRLPMEGVQNIEHWFKPESWSALTLLYRTIDSLNCSSAEQDFFFCVFSSILRWVSNADDQTQKTYVSGTLKKVPPPVWDTFRRFLARALAGVEKLDAVRRTGSAEILDGSALSIPLPDGTVDLVVTSPPYLDSVDYMYNFMLEYFWLGPRIGVASRADYNLRRRAPVGAKNPSQRVSDLSPSISDLICMEEIPAYRREAVLSYFESMSLHFEEAARVMKDGGRYVLVVGNSQAQTGVIPVHDCLLRIARDAGLHLEKAFAYRVRRHYMKFPRRGRGGIILMDWVITLKKSKRAILPIEDRLPLPNITIGTDEVAN
jgi:tRNA G10  N-methylase Trm11